jgi:hypothetical protein
MKIDLIDLDQPSTQQTVRIEGLSRDELRAATWRGDDLLVRTQSGQVVVLKSALPRLLDKPSYFLVLDDAPVPLAAFAPGLTLAPATSAPHVPPFGVSAPWVIGRSPTGRRGIERTASQGDEAWADHAWAMLEATAHDVARTAPAPVVTARSGQVIAEPADDEPVVVSCECPPEDVDHSPIQDESTLVGASMPVGESAASGASSGAASINLWTWLSWAAMAKGSYEIASRNKSGSNATQAAATSANAGSDAPTGAVATQDTSAVNEDAGNGGSADFQVTADDASNFMQALTATPGLGSLGGDGADLLAAARSATSVIG